MWYSTSILSAWRRLDALESLRLSRSRTQVSSSRAVSSWSMTVAAANIWFTSVLLWGFCVGENEGRRLRQLAVLVICISFSPPYPLPFPLLLVLLFI